MFGFSTASASSGAPAGPAGCGVALIVINIVLLLISAFIAVIWLTLGETGQL